MMNNSASYQLCRRAPGMDPKNTAEQRINMHARRRRQVDGWSLRYDKPGMFHLMWSVNSQSVLTIGVMRAGGTRMERYAQDDVSRRRHLT